MLKVKYDTQRNYISTLHTSNFIKSSTTYMISFYIQETSYNKMTKKILHNGEYQSR